jgi:hypothetical protein
MHSPQNICSLATVAVALAVVAPSAYAQETNVITCQYFGGPPHSEPLGDREGHSLSIADVSCVATSGPLAGGVETGRVISEFDKAKGVLLMGGGVVRKPGATAVYQITEQSIALTITDGKVTGSSIAGRSKYLLATGSFAPLAGKTGSFTIKPGAPGQYIIEETLD